MSSALAKASSKRRLGYISDRRSLLIISRVSTYLRISSAPASALLIFFMPSNRKGMVTMPTVSRPRSRAMRATTGAAPVPVPPPIEAVMNTMSVSSVKRRSMSAALSSAAWKAFSGMFPAPRPLVTVGPMRTLVGTGERRRACWSVFITTNDTHWIFCLNMWLTALLPPPPTPITIIRSGS